MRRQSAQCMRCVRTPTDGHLKMHRVNSRHGIYGHDPLRHFVGITVKVKFSHTRYRALGPELIPVYRQSARRWREVHHAIDLAVGCHYFLPGLRLPPSFHQMALPVNGSTHLIPALLLICRSRKDERLSWPNWLTCSGWFTHISGHPSAAGRAQDR